MDVHNVYPSSLRTSTIHRLTFCANIFVTICEHGERSQVSRHLSAKPANVRNTDVSAKWFCRLSSVSELAICSS